MSTKLSVFVQCILLTVGTLESSVKLRFI